MRVAVLGAGWLGEPLARALAAAGHAVRVTATTPERRDALRRDGLDAHVLRLPDDAHAAHPAFDADAVVLAVPPPRGEGRADRYAEMAHAVAEAAAQAGVRRLAFTSSTGVYADLGRVVAEGDAGPREGAPLSAGGAAVWAAEEALRAAGVPLTVLRLAGLYGPGRDFGRWLAGRDGVPGGRAPVNLVHRDDAVRAAAWALGRPPGTFNVVAEAHPAKAALYPARARALGLDPPAFRDERGAWKEVSGARLRAAGFALAHPDPAAWDGH